MEEAQCLFCNITSGKMPSFKVYEDEHVIAVLDIRPATKGHTLVFPKKHHAFITDMPYEEMKYLFGVARTLMGVVMSAVKVQSANILYSAGTAAGQKSPHLFLNIIPRTENDGVNIGWEVKQMGEEEFKTVQQNIINTLATLGGQRQSSETQPATGVQPKTEPQPEQKKELPEYHARDESSARYW
jgi:histidine triad (HIT) family protein